MGDHAMPSGFLKPNTGDIQWEKLKQKQPMVGKYLKHSLCIVPPLPLDKNGEGAPSQLFTEGRGRCTQDTYNIDVSIPLKKNIVKIKLLFCIFWDHLLRQPLSAATFAYGKNDFNIAQ